MWIMSNYLESWGNFVQFTDILLLSHLSSPFSKNPLQDFLKLTSDSINIACIYYLWLLAYFNTKLQIRVHGVNVL